MKVMTYIYFNYTKLRGACCEWYSVFDPSVHGVISQSVRQSCFFVSATSIKSLQGISLNFLVICIHNLEILTSLYTRNTCPLNLEYCLYIDKSNEQYISTTPLKLLHGIL